MSNLLAIILNIVALPIAFIYDVIRLASGKTSRVQRAEIDVNDLTFYTNNVMGMQS